MANSFHSLTYADIHSHTGAYSGNVLINTLTLNIIVGTESTDAGSQSVCITTEFQPLDF